MDSIIIMQAAQNINTNKGFALITISKRRLVYAKRRTKQKTMHTAWFLIGALLALVFQLERVMGIEPT